MLKLMKLEIKKFKLVGYIRKSIITIFILFSVLLFMFWVSSAEGDTMASSPKELVTLISVLINATFLIFSSVMLAGYVIGEYKNKTINILFTYPINRKKLIYAKLLLVGSFIFLSFICAHFFILGAFYLINQTTAMFSFTLTSAFIGNTILNFFISSIAFTCISFVSLYFGMLKKSTTATIVSAVIIVSVIGSSSNGASLSSIIYVPITLALIGLVLVYIAFKDIEKKDVL